MRPRPAIWKVLVSAILMFAAARLLVAETASVRGRVFDPSGAVVSHATVTLTDSAGSTTTATTGNDGWFSVDEGNHKGGENRTN